MNEIKKWRKRVDARLCLIFTNLRNDPDKKKEKGGKENDAQRLQLLGSKKITDVLVFLSVICGKKKEKKKRGNRHFDETILGARGNARGVGAPVDRVDFISVSWEVKEKFLGGDLPDLDGTVLAATHNDSAVG